MFVLLCNQIERSMSPCSPLFKNITITFKMFLIHFLITFEISLNCVKHLQIVLYQKELCIE